MRHEQRRTTERGIAMLSIWLDSRSDGADLTHEVTRVLAEGHEATLELIVGLTNVAGVLLVKAGGTDNCEREILQDIALDVAQEP